MPLKSMFEFPAALLWISSLANLYLVALIVQLAWDNAHCAAGAWAGFEIAMRIATVSLPISGLMVIFALFWAAMRFAVRRHIDPSIKIGQVLASGLNMAAPLLLWSCL